MKQKTRDRLEALECTVQALVDDLELQVRKLSQLRDQQRIHTNTVRNLTLEHKAVAATVKELEARTVFKEKLLEHFTNNAERRDAPPLHMWSVGLAPHSVSIDAIACAVVIAETSTSARALVRALNTVGCHRIADIGVCSRMGAVRYRTPEVIAWAFGESL